MLVAGQPRLAPVGRVQLRVVPEQGPDGVGWQPLAEQIGVSGSVSDSTWPDMAVPDSHGGSRPALDRAQTGEPARSRILHGRSDVERVPDHGGCRPGGARAAGRRLGHRIRRPSGWPALAITTATYGRTSAAATSTQRSQPEPTTIAPTKQTVRMPIEMQVAPLPGADVVGGGCAARR